MGKVGILLDRAERIAQIHRQRSFGKTRVSHPAGQLGNGGERLGM